MIDWIKNINPFKSEQKTFVSDERPEHKASLDPTFAVSLAYNGEKSLGEIGPVINYTMNFEILRQRSWQSFIESPVTQIVIKKYAKWIVGKGLELECQPSMVYLKEKKVSIDQEAFCESVESQFDIFVKSKNSSYSKMQNIQELAKTAFDNSKIGGDVLTILRYENNQLTVQVVDGSHVKSPLFTSSEIQGVKNRGNRISNGVEIAPNGEHIAYFVSTSYGVFERVKAKNSAGLTMAFMTYGLKYRIDECRGVPLIAVVLEDLAKLERYKNATVSSAEERAKLTYFIEHNHQNSTGENPLISQLAKVSNINAKDDVPVTFDGKQLGLSIAATTNKQTINMPLGSTLKSLESKNDLYFAEFFTVNINLICSTLGIPPEVALSKYDSNFSASRAALKDWEHTILIDREDFSSQWYRPIYNTWLALSVYSKKINIQGYVKAVQDKNNDIIEAISMSSFVGPTVPHIDPLKEVQAQRLKLGVNAEGIPLTSLQSAVRTLNEGNSDANMSQFAEEFKEAKKLGLIPEKKV